MINPQRAAIADQSDDVDFAYWAGDASATRLTLSIFADRVFLRDDMHADAMEAGFRIAEASDLGALIAGDARSFGDVVLVDCPVIDAGVMAALARLDVRAAQAGVALVVSTSVEALDDVFGCLDQSNAQILVTPSRGERLIALGRIMARRTGRVCELSEADRMVLMRLSEQVDAIGARLERLKGDALAGLPDLPPTTGQQDSPAIFRFDRPPLPGDRTDLATAKVSSLPKPRLVRSVIRQRQMRARFFAGDLFADPAWDMLLDLTAARAEQAKVSVTSLCIASGVPPTTALRWIAQMTDGGLLQREDDIHDRRRAFIALTEKASDGMSRFFAALGDEPAPLT